MEALGIIQAGCRLALLCETGFEIYDDNCASDQ
jgi:hypothetical protein